MDVVRLAMQMLGSCCSGGTVRALFQVQTCCRIEKEMELAGKGVGKLPMYEQFWVPNQ